MKIQHLYPESEPLIVQHVQMLGYEPQDAVPDIVHVHGCWWQRGGHQLHHPRGHGQQTQEVYRKVMDSNTLELMSQDGRQLMKLLLKAGITGDRRWVTDDIPAVDEQEWRRLLIYADHENVRTVIDLGARILGINHPYIETGQIQSYLPTDYQKPKVKAHDVAGLVAEMHHGPLTLRHFVELDRALRNGHVEDDLLNDSLEEKRLLKYFRRLLLSSSTN